MIPFQLPNGLTIYQGATLNKKLFKYNNPDNTPFNFGARTGRAEIRLTADDNVVLGSFDTANGTMLLDSSDGSVTLLMDALTTAALSFDKAVMDIELVNGAIVERMCSADVMLSKEVTKNV